MKIESDSHQREPALAPPLTQSAADHDRPEASSTRRWPQARFVFFFFFFWVVVSTFFDRNMHVRAFKV